MHKAELYLLEQRAIRKEDRLYELNVDWLEQLISFGFETKKAYAQGRGRRIFP